MTPRALIVDDSLTVRKDLEEALRSAGFDTVPCGTAAEGRTALRAGGFAIVVLDVLLPDGDGIDLLREIRAAGGHLPVLLLSTEAEVRDRIRGLKTGADEYVGKPYDASYVVARAKELARHAPGEARSTVLVIDDSTTYREELRRALERAGYTVITAASGEEGLRTAVGARPAVVIVDGVLPGIDGAGVIRRIRQDAVLRRTPCLLLTASEDRGGELRALEAGADAYVRKEVETDVILLRLVALLRSAPSPAADAAPASFLGPKRILAVDDSLTYLQELAAQLRAEGYDVVTARSGEEALELLAVQPPDCILLDLIMPGLSGHDACKRIKGTPGWREIPLMILTALDERDAMIAGINSGADDYIPKSSDFDVLKARLRAQLRRRQFEDENRAIREELLRKGLEAAEARSAREVAETRAQLLAELERKNKELESFSYSVSHDLRAPLRAIDGFCRILEEDHAPKLDAEARRCIDIVRRNARRMGELIDDLLQFSRMGRQSLKAEPIAMDALFRSVFEELQAPGGGRRIEFKVGAMPSAHADRAMMRQVLANLVANAIKYTAPRESAVIEAGGRATEEGIAYFVRDNGVGFDMRYAHKLFGVFQRLHSAEEFEGTGVGLAIVQRILERHGGRVWAEGELGAGATFHFSLPLKGGRA